MSFRKREREERKGFFFLPVGDLLIRGKILKQILLWNMYLFALKFSIFYILKNPGYVMSAQLVIIWSPWMLWYLFSCSRSPREVDVEGSGGRSPAFDLGTLSRLPQSEGVLCGTPCALFLRHLQYTPDSTMHGPLEQFGCQCRRILIKILMALEQWDATEAISLSIAFLRIV